MAKSQLHFCSVVNNIKVSVPIQSDNEYVIRGK